MAGLISAFAAFYLAPHWNNISARQLMMLVASIAVWSFAYAMEFNSVDLDLKLWWVKVEYLGNAWVGLMFFRFILAITGNFRHLTQSRQMLLNIVPCLVIVMALTNGYHQLMWQNAWLDFSGNTPMVVYHRGPGFWLFVVYSYLLIGIATTVLVHAFVFARRILRKQLQIILFGVLFPFLCNVLYLFFPDSLKNLDLTVFGFMISGIVFVWGLSRYYLLDMIPIAHEAIIDSMVDPVIVLDINDRIVDVNKAARSTFEIEDELVAGLNAEKLLPDLLATIKKYRSPQPIETKMHLLMDSQQQQWNIGISPLLSRKGQHNGWLITLRDITDRRRAEAALKESERMHRTVLEAAPNPIVYYNEKGEVTYLNPAFTKVFGWKSWELLGGEIDFVPKENIAETAQIIQKTIEHPDSIRHLITKRSTQNGDVLDVTISMAVCQDNEGSPADIVAIYTDITQFRQTERELRNTKNYIRGIINSMPSILIGVDGRTRVTRWNHEAEKMTRVNADTALGKTIDEIFPELAAKIPHIDQIIIDRETRKETKVLLTINDQEVYVDITVYPILSEDIQSAVIRVDDITERVKIQEMMIQNEKMLSIGTLAGGIAHDFNNILSGILAFAQVAKIHADDLKKTHYNLDHVIRGVKRAATLVQQILTFSRQSAYQMQPLRISAVVEEALNLLRSTIPATIKIKEDIVSDGIVVADATKIHQVVMNLCTNAYQSMADTPGVLTITLKKITLTRKDCELDMQITPGEYLRFLVADTGQGMPPHILNRIFEPYFTTKKQGQGMGLGLAMVRGIVEEHKGCIRVDSEPGKGTQVQILLPVSSEDVHSDTIPLEKGPLKTGTEHILLVEDDPDILEGTRMLLEDCGYLVKPCSDGASALAHFKKEKGGFDLVITGMTMPEMTGDKLTREILDMVPDCPVILWTGFAQNISRKEAFKIGVTAFLEKPVTARDLVTTVRKVLDRVS